MKSYIEMFNSDKYELFIINQSYAKGDVTNQTLIDIKGKGIICFAYILLRNGYYSTALNVEIGIDGNKFSSNNTSGRSGTRGFTSRVIDSCYKEISYFDSTSINFNSLVESTNIYMDNTSDTFFPNNVSDNIERHFVKPLLFNNSFYYKVVSYEDGYKDRYSAGSAKILLLGFKLKE